MAWEERGENRYLEFVYLELFERTRNGVISDEEMKVLEDELLENPEKGSMQRDTGAVRKVRVATRGGRKSGGARVVYLYVQARETIYLLLAFPKNVQPNLTADQKKALRKLVAKLKKEA
jgi:hypothetical protein